jgi:hypothetical protein
MRRISKTSAHVVICKSRLSKESFNTSFGHILTF